jgi:hypothetical protein
VIAAISLSGKPWGQKGKDRNEYTLLIQTDIKNIINIIILIGIIKDLKGKETPRKAKALPAIIARTFVKLV